MEDLINQKVKEYFDIDYVFPFQRLVISNTLKASGYYSDEDKDESIPRQIVLLPTGAGKSLCFMLPGILETGSTVTILKGGMSSDEKSTSINRYLIMK